MKKSLTFLFVCFFSVLVCSAQSGEWKLVDSTLNACIYKSVKCPDSNNCIAIGNESLDIPIIKLSSDRGFSWETVLWDRQGYRYDSSGNKYYYYPPRAADIAYRNNFIFAIGDSGCYWLSRDRGINWETGKLESWWGEDRINYYHIDMYDENIGAVTCPIDLFITTDGWKSYKKIDFNFLDSLTPQVFKDISCPDSNTVIALAYRTGRGYYIVSSKDRGITWSANSTIPLSGTNIFFMDKNNGYAVGGSYKVNTNVYKDIIHHTTDGGKTWVTQLDTLEYQYQGLNDIHFIDSLNGIAVGYWYKLWRTTNAGATWIKDTSYNYKVGDGYFSDVVMLSPTDYIGVTDMSGKIYRYTGDWSSVDEYFYPEKNDEILTYPNPASDYIDINSPAREGAGGVSEIGIYNMLGVCLKKIPQSDLTPALSEGEGVRVDVSGLAAGVYFVRMGSEVGMFVKE